MKHITLALLLLGAILSFDIGLASPVHDIEARSPKPGRPPKRAATCSPVTITKTLTHGPKKTITTTITSTPQHCPTPTTITSTPKHCPTPTTTTFTVTSSTTSTVPTSECPSCSSCPPPSAVTVTRTLDWEDIDGLAASRVPIPDNYHGFSHFNPDQNKVYRSGPPPVSVGNGVQVAYANDGKFGLGALGFVIQWRSFWILTFLDPDNGITEATLRVSGTLVSTHIQTITTDRQFVQILAPLSSSNTAVGFYIEVFAGSGVDGPRLPFWLDDFVYTRNFWPATCCQNAGIYRILNFDDLEATGDLIPFPYHNFYFQGPWTVVTLPEWPFQRNVLHYPSYPQAASITSPTPFDLIRVTIFIPQGTDPATGVMKHTVVTITGHGPTGEQINLGWSIPSVTFQPGPVRLDLGGDWSTYGGSWQGTGFFASTEGFNGINEVRIMVQEVDYAGTGEATTMEFWLDDWQYQISC